MEFYKINITANLYSCSDIFKIRQMTITKLHLYTAGNRTVTNTVEPSHINAITLNVHTDTLSCRSNGTLAVFIL